MKSNVSKTLTLPCGAILSNRFAKSAMSENMADSNHHPGKPFVHAYTRWAQGGSGLCISGNVMVDSQHLGEANNVVIEEKINNVKDLSAWAQSSKGTKNKIWLQLNHPGKQTPKFLTKLPVAPSAISLKPPFDKMFNLPRELSNSEIKDIVKRFAFAAKRTKEAGFDGVQIHGAHGYLVSQFLSPRHNQREDEWGGDIKKRAKFVTEVYLAIREAVGESFPIGIKMNSADFSKGGFTHDEAIWTAKHLSELGIDLIELSGGSYETPVMMGASKSTIEREAYFIDYAKEVKKAIHCPLMLTGGFKTAEFMNEVIHNGEVDLVGLGRSLCLDPNLPEKLLEGKNVKSLVKPLTTGHKKLDGVFPLEIIWLSVYKVILKNIFHYGFEGLKRVRGKI